MKKILTTAMAVSLSLACFGCDSDSSATEISSSNTENGSLEVAASLAGSSITEEQFATKDYEVGTIYDNYVEIALADGATSADGDGISIDGNTVTITDEGSYSFSGTLSNGQIVVDVDEETKIQIILDGVNISNDSSAAIYVKSADKVYVTTESGTENILSVNIVEDETAETNVDAAIFSSADLSLNGEGSIVIEAINGNGITTKDDLAITSGTYDIVADNHGLEANNSVRIAGGTFDLTTLNDGIHAEHDDADKGYIYILDGDFKIDAQGDGMDASSFIEIEDGNFDIVVAGGSPEVSETSSTSTMSGQGMTGMTGMTGGRGDMTGMTMEIPEGVEIPEGTEIPEMTDRTEMQSGMQSGMQSDMTGRTEMTEIPEGVEIPEMTDHTEMQSQMQSGMTGRTEMTEGVEIPEGTEIPEMTDRTEMQSQMQAGMTGQMDMTSTEEEDDSISTKAIKADTAIAIFGGTFNIDTYDDAIHSNGTVYIAGGEFAIAAGDDAIKAETINCINGGDINISTCYEGLEAQAVVMAGGDVNITSQDDGINATKSEYADADLELAIYITGGALTIDSYNAGDGLDSNSNIYVSGGETLISSTTATTDTALDYGGSAYITGGSFIASGSTSQTRQNFDETSTQSSIMIDFASSQTGEVSLTDSSGNVVYAWTPAKAYQTVHISTANIEVGETYTITAGDESYTFEMASNIYGENDDNGPGGMTGGTGMTGGMSQGGGGGGR